MMTGRLCGRLPAARDQLAQETRHSGGLQVGEHPTRGLVTPFPFVPMAEQLGKIGGGSFKRHPPRIRPSDGVLITHLCGGGRA